MQQSVEMASRVFGYNILTALGILLASSLLMSLQDPSRLAIMLFCAEWDFMLFSIISSTLGLGRLAGTLDKEEKVAIYDETTAGFAKASLIFTLIGFATGTGVVISLF